MRRWSTIVGVLVVLAAAYWAWPFFGAWQLVSAAQRGNPAELVERVNIPALRRSLARQISGAYLKISGKAGKLGAIGRGFAGAAATTVADPYVAELLTPDNLTALIGQGRIGRVKLGDQEVAINRSVPNVAELLRADVLSAITGSYFDGIASFAIPVTTPGGSDEDFAIHLRLDGLVWRLSGLDLPPAVVEEMARAILGKDAAPDRQAAPAP